MDVDLDGVGRQFFVEPVESLLDDILGREAARAPQQQFEEGKLAAGYGNWFAANRDLPRRPIIFDVAQHHFGGGDLTRSPQPGRDPPPWLVSIKRLDAIIISAG